MLLKKALKYLFHLLEGSLIDRDAINDDLFTSGGRLLECMNDNKCGATEQNQQLGCT